MGHPVNIANIANIVNNVNTEHHDRVKKQCNKIFLRHIKLSLLTPECYLNKWHGMYLNHAEPFNGKFDFHELWLIAGIEQSSRVADLQSGSRKSTWLL